MTTSNGNSHWLPKLISAFRGHPIMTSTRRRRGVRLRWTHGDGEGVSSMWTSTQKIRAQSHHWHHPVFFSCKEVGIFYTRISSL